MAFSLFGKAQECYTELWKAIIRPPRDEYSIGGFGPKKFQLRDGRQYIRSDFSVISNKGEKLVASHFEPFKRPSEKLPCVIYLHGNSSSRLEALPIIPYLLPLNLTVVAYDFAGCGQSEGEYVTLGDQEHKDLVDVINYLRENRAVSLVALLGRSMGAVTALLHAHKDPTVSGIVCDSPFSNLRSLAEELADQILRVSVPKFVVNSILNMVSHTSLNQIVVQLKTTIKSKSGVMRFSFAYHPTQLDIDKLDILKTAGETYVPAMFISAVDDQLVKSHHSEALFKSYTGDKWLVFACGDHNTARSTKIMNSIAIFFYNTLHCEMIFRDLHPRDLSSWGQLSIKASSISVFRQSALSTQAQCEYYEMHRAIDADSDSDPPGEEDDMDDAIRAALGEPASSSNTGIGITMRPPSRNLLDAFNISSDSETPPSK